MVRVLGISIWIYFIWIFVVGILLFFHTIHGFSEGFQNSAPGSASGSFRILSGSSLSLPNKWVNKYTPPTSGSGIGTWQPINATTDRLTYQQQLPIGGQLFSSNAKYALLFATDHYIYLYNTKTYVILWSFYTGINSSYLHHLGDIQVINTNSTNASSPFINSSTTSGSWFTDSTSDLVQSVGTNSYNKTQTYLQLLDNGELVINAVDGTRIFQTNTGNPNVFECVIEPSVYQFQQGDCYDLQNSITSLESTITTLTASLKTQELNTAKQIHCNFQQYYKNNNCGTYLNNSSPASSSQYESGSALRTLAPPTVTIYGNLTTGSNTLTITPTNTNISGLVNSGDMIYLGYGVDIQGPFVVKSINTMNATMQLTKHYIGADITNAVVSIKPMIVQDTLVNFKASPIQSQITATDIPASVYPGESYIAIDSVSNDSGSFITNPPNINLGDLVYIHKDTCNQYDTDNGDGTCTSYLCNVGELDIGNNRCKSFVCGVTNVGSTLQPYIKVDTDNGNGTCTTSDTYSDCLIGETYVYSDSGGTCTVDKKEYEIPYKYTRNRAVNRGAYIYNKISNGIVDTVVSTTGIYTKGGDKGNIPYIYSKSLGPFVVALTPSANKILIKSFTPGDLDANGNFMLNSTAAWHKSAELWAKYAANPKYNMPTGTTKTIGAFPNVNTGDAYQSRPDFTQNLNSLSKDGLVNAKLYKAAYNDGAFNGSYTSIGDIGAASRRDTGSSVQIVVPNSISVININNTNLIPGEIYILVINAKASAICSMQLKSGSSIYPTEKGTWGNETPGYINGAVLGTYTSLDIAKRMCEANPACVGVTQSGTQYSIRTVTGTSTILTSPSGETSWLITRSTRNSVNLTPNYVAYTWKFIASNPTLSISITSSTNATLEFNRLTIKGGINGATLIAGKTSNASVLTPLIDSGICTSGYYKSTSGCIKCPKGQYSSGQDSATCTSCPAGTYSDLIGSTQCKTCPAGKYSSAGSETCASCPTGTYSNTVGATSNTVCLTSPAGKFSPPSSNVLVNCPMGTYNTNTGSTNIDECTKCPAGTSSSVGGATSSAVCSACPAGTFSSEGKCIKCPGGTSSTAVGATSSSTCVPCSPGYYSPEGSTSCIICAQDTYSQQSASSCTPCAAGTGVKTTGALECCSPGYYYSVSEKKCIKCPLDTYGGVAGSLSCNFCPGIEIGNIIGHVSITCTSTDGQTSQNVCLTSNCPSSGPRIGTLETEEYDCVSNEAANAYTIEFNMGGWLFGPWNPPRSGCLYREKIASLPTFS